MPDEVLVVGRDRRRRGGLEHRRTGARWSRRVDFFTPIVDDPYDWGRIAATNAFSDVYAMGGTPVLALNIVGWPVDDLPLEMLGARPPGRAATWRPTPARSWSAGTRSRDPSRSTGWWRSGSPTPTGWCATPRRAPGERLFLTKPLGTRADRDRDQAGARDRRAGARPRCGR